MVLGGINKYVFLVRNGRTCKRQLKQATRQLAGGGCGKESWVTYVLLASNIYSAALIVS